MTLNELTRFAHKFLEEEYGLSLDIPIKVNNRLSTSNGRFVHMRNSKEALRIELNGKMLVHDTIDFVIGTLKHELVHYALHELGKPFKDGDAYFEKELKRVGAPSTRTRASQRPSHHYSCSKCGTVSTFSRRFDTKRYVSACCRERFIYEGLK